MRLVGRNVVGIAILMALCLISGNARAQEQPQREKTPAAQKESAVALPDLDELIPLSTELYGRLAVLESRIRGMPDISEVEKKFAEIDASLKDPAEQLQEFKASKEYRYVRLLDLKRQLGKEGELFDKISPPLRRSIHQLGSWRKEWLAEKERWKGWQSSMRDEEGLDHIKSTFTKANDTIDRAIQLIDPKLEEMLGVQERAGAIQGKMKSLAVDVDGLIMMSKKRIIFDLSPAMFSREYFSQFRIDLWYAVRNGVAEISWPGRQFFEERGWIVLLQVFLFFVVVIAAYRNRRVLRTTKRWSFIAARPFATGLFAGFMSTALLYEYAGVPLTWKVANSIIAGISFVRLTGDLVKESWKRQFVYGLVTVLIINRLLYLVTMPLPVVRLYYVIVSFAGFFLCLRWARLSGRDEEPGLHPWLLRLISLYLTVIIIAELFGKKGLALYLFASLADSLATILVFMLFLYMIHGGVEWLFRVSPLQQGAALIADDTHATARKVSRFIDLAVLALLLAPALLRIWGAFDSLEGATEHLWHFGVSVGTLRITVGLVIMAACVLYGSFLVSWIFQRTLLDKVLVSRQAERGVRLAVGRLVHYAIIIAGFLLALSTLGIEITKLTIMLSALGVGIGFGLQGVVNNFVSGLILLFERPIRVGDFIEYGGNWSEVRSIGLRSTTVQTFDSSDVIIPNADLISNRVTNWTLSNRRRRVDIPVGVAYGSDIPLVMETLLSCAGTNTKLIETPAPQVLFLRFGESSLEFELRVFVSDVRYSLDVISELHGEIDRRFREAKIEIAFPQRDLHLRSVDESVKVRTPETGKQDAP